MNRPGHRLTKAFRKILALVVSKDSFARSRSVIIVAFAILGIWLTVVIYIASRHEFWRDEVRALSLARAAITPLDLYGLIQYEGHPVLWYLVLYIGKSIVDTPLVLPVISLAIAFAAVAVFLFFSPFPFWIRCLFIFSALPLYEYSVSARNYGISMLLLFVCALLYRSRAKHPFWLAVVLALLANTNVHSAMLACLIAFVWAWDTVAENWRGPVRKRALAIFLPFEIVIAAVLLCAAFTMPRPNTIVTSVHHVSMRDLGPPLRDAVLRPDQTFYHIVPAGLPPWVGVALIYLAVFGLLHRPNLLLAALGAQIGLGVLFRVVYPGDYRHQGLFLVFLLFLYWLFIQSLKAGTVTRTKRLLFNMGLYVAMLTLILVTVAKTKDSVGIDLSHEMSSNRAFGEFLNNSENYRDAIIVPEPDYVIESLPYYAKNRIYISREHRFGNTVSWTTAAKVRLSLSELLAIARGIKYRERQPVLIVLGHWEVNRDKPGEKRYSYNKVFSWNTNEAADFYNSTMLIREFGSAYSDENYKVYLLK